MYVLNIYQVVCVVAVGYTFKVSEVKPGAVFHNNTVQQISEIYSTNKKRLR